MRIKHYSDIIMISISIAQLFQSTKPSHLQIRCQCITFSSAESRRDRFQDFPEEALIAVSGAPPTDVQLQCSRVHVANDESSRQNLELDHWEFPTSPIRPAASTLLRNRLDSISSNASTRASCRTSHVQPHVHRQPMFRTDGTTSRFVYAPSRFTWSGLCQLLLTLSSRHSTLTSVPHLDRDFPNPALRRLLCFRRNRLPQRAANSLLVENPTGMRPEPASPARNFHLQNVQITPNPPSLQRSRQLWPIHRPAAATRTRRHLVVQNGVPVCSHKMEFYQPNALFQPYLRNPPQASNSVFSVLHTQSTDPTLRKAKLNFNYTARHFSRIKPELPSKKKIPRKVHRNSHS